jgi:hypothetical protein
MNGLLDVSMNGWPVWLVGLLYNFAHDPEAFVFTEVVSRSMNEDSL